MENLLRFNSKDEDTDQCNDQHCDVAELLLMKCLRSFETLISHAPPL